MMCQKDTMQGNTDSSLGFDTVDNDSKDDDD